jgi:hypothetical protein
MKQRNPNSGCPRIAQQIALAFHIPIDKDVVRRIPARRWQIAKFATDTRISSMTDRRNFTLPLFSS